ncbi:hypothetical protein C8Q72DRAFT_799792 [Fomitopsis betulina]|nr:hypothetical protein C8Q72DRAFT_799792 [Fomitopsis betulina]
MKEQHEQEKAERRAKEIAEEQKKAEKQTQGAQCAEFIAQETKMRIFGTLSSYKHKDDLIILAGALGLSIEGTIPVLTARIREHLQDPGPPATEMILNEPGSRFVGLFPGSSSRHTQGAARGRGHTANQDDVASSSTSTSSASTRQAGPAVAPEAQASNTAMPLPVSLHPTCLMSPASQPRYPDLHSSE